MSALRPCPGLQCAGACGGQPVEVTREGNEFAIAVCAHAQDPRMTHYYVLDEHEDTLWPAVAGYRHAEGLVILGRP